MATTFYTPPPPLHSSPQPFTMMNNALPPHLLPAWSWRQPAHHSILTPPMTTSLRVKRPQMLSTPLPPISQLDLRLPLLHPLTPPRSTTIQSLPPIQQLREYAPPPSNEPLEIPFVRPESQRFVDWLDMSRQQSAAEKTCEMICYLWFSTRSPSVPNSTHSRSRGASTLQLVANPLFVNFMRKVLETTQVSESVIVLSLHYIYRLKERNWCASAQPGSEFRIAVAALMMANKFLDDNTYTNKTWSEVSGIDLTEINRMEREFLIGIDSNLFVDKQTYESWLNLLKGLVMAKERDSQYWRRSRVPQRSLRPAPSYTAHQPPAVSRPRPVYHRARSSSPDFAFSRVSPNQYNFTFSDPRPNLPLVHPPSPEYSPFHRPGIKRNAAAAFSPTTENFTHIPSKRPPLMSLEIPPPRDGPPSASDEPLQSFARMSLCSSPARNSAGVTRLLPTSVPDTSGKTLISAYQFDERNSTRVPQNLYFYSLTCSPTDSYGDNRIRKAKLRYHQPPPLTTHYYLPPPTRPTNVQSARSSPHLFHTSVPTPPPLPTLRHIVTEGSQHPSVLANEFGSPIRPAPFANAGPPGVRFYAVPLPQANLVSPSWSR